MKQVEMEMPRNVGKKKKKKKKKGSKGAGKNNNTLTQGLPQELEALHNQMMQDVGKRLRVYHARYDEWYKGMIEMNRRAN